MKITLNGETVHIGSDIDPTMPLLWFVRDFAGLQGTKFGCGIGQCGACTLHVNDRAVRSCSLPLSALADGDTVVTIEGLANGAELHPVQQAWKDLDVPQCGYCQAGQMMAVVDLLKTHPRPTDRLIDAEHDNLCRCGTYDRIRKAIHHAADLMEKGQQSHTGGAS